jgi:transcriptional regulator with XRE-family HTH domain
MGKRRVRLADARKARGLTQRDLADKAGVPQQAISAYEAGRKEPLVTRAQRIAQALGIAVDDMDFSKRVA